MAAAARIAKFDLAEARDELFQKSLPRIEIETAYKWGARAVVAYEAYAATKTAKISKKALCYLLRGYACEHEALEHAAEGGILSEIATALKKARKRFGIELEL